MQSELQELERAWEIHSQDVALERKIGTGSFGEVWTGRWQGITVAVKKINSMGLFNDEEAMRDFIKEMKV